MPGEEEYRGRAWYRRTFEALKEWDSQIVRIEFEAVFHSASVWVNGPTRRCHLRKGYTSFILDITRTCRLGAPNAIVVQVDNSFDGSDAAAGVDPVDWGA